VRNSGYPLLSVELLHGLSTEGLFDGGEETSWATDGTEKGSPDVKSGGDSREDISEGQNSSKNSTDDWKAAEQASDDLQDTAEEVLDGFDNSVKEKANDGDETIAGEGNGLLDDATVDHGCRQADQQEDCEDLHCSTVICITVERKHKIIKAVHNRRNIIGHVVRIVQ
jgi:hypothetical protein